MAPSNTTTRSRIANKVTDIISGIPQYNYPGPYEDILLKEG